MRFIFLFVSILCITSWVFAETTTDNQLIDKEQTEWVITVTPIFEIKKFKNCTDMEETMAKILENYQWQMPYYYGRPMPMMMEKAVDSLAGVADTTNSTRQSSSKDEAYSTTNIQVAWVDEAEIIKTDGKYIYFFHDGTSNWYYPVMYREDGTKDDSKPLGKNIFIVEKASMKIIKKIRIPSTYIGTELYISEGKIVITATKYTNIGSRWYGWYNGEQKAIIAIYNLSEINNPQLERYIQFDGSLIQSRLIANKLYTITQNAINIPPIYANEKDYLKKFKETFSIKSVIPRVRDTLMKEATGKYSQENKPVASCDTMEYILPDKKTSQKYQLNPAFSTVSMIDIKNVWSVIKSKVLFWDIGEIHMSTKWLYLLSRIWTEGKNNNCPPNARCFAPTFGQNSTLIHKFTLDNSPASYIYTSLVNGNLLNQYSMDEDGNDNFRIVTQEYWVGEAGGNTNYTTLSILAKDGTLTGTLSHIAEGENFQSSRFIDDRLYLVTFKQIDPLFVIDIKDPTYPNILGELKIPGYSTYLHPYDTNRLIGIWYDAFENQWGWTQNGGIKIDLYNVEDTKNPKRESTITIGWAGSSSDVLNNPKLFVWYKEKWLLLMPAIIMNDQKVQISEDETNTGNSSEDETSWIVEKRIASIHWPSTTWQGTLILSVKPAGIKELWRITHIDGKNLENKWKKECASYGKNTIQKPKCYKLIGGWEYCEPINQQYVPPYCYEWSSIDNYLSQNIWQLNNSFIIRNLYIGDTLYTISNEKMLSTNIESNEDTWEIIWK